MNDWEHAWTERLLAVMSNQAGQPEAADARPILLGFLEVLDAVDRLAALASTADTNAAAKGAGWADHLQALRQQMADVFGEAGVVFFECQGRPFDPERHEIVRVEMGHDVADYTILAELSRGCEWQGQLLRVARVVVARQGKKEA